MGRSIYAVAALKAAGVIVIMSLADTEKSAPEYDGYNDTYYANQKVIYLNLRIDFASEDFQKGLAKGLRFLA